MSFNPRPRVGGDSLYIHTVRCFTCFNPRPRVGGDRRSVGIDADLQYMGFQSAPPRGGRPISTHLSSKRFYRCFNPRPRVGGDASHAGAELRPRCTRVSIRAPAWGATCALPRESPATSFQSAPPRGGDSEFNRGTSLVSGFNPRPRVGGDCEMACPLVGQGRRVSIRAPAWGATRVGRLAQRHSAVSIRAPALGATRSRRPSPAPGSCFNPRPRVGGDIFVGSQRPRPADSCFNPRPRVGGDGNRRNTSDGQPVSIAPPRGGRHVGHQP